MKDNLDRNRRMFYLNDEKCKKIINDLNSLVDFIDLLEDSFFGKSFICSSKTIDCSRLLESLNVTFINIIIYCENYCLADSMILLRKFKDDLWFILYMLTYKSKFRESTIDDSIFSNVNNWMNNKLEHLTSKKIINEIFEFNGLNDLDEKYKVIDSLKRMAETMEDYVHSNGLIFYNSSICSVDNLIYKNLNQILVFATNNILFFVIILAIKFPNCIASSDYGDYIDFGLNPPNGSQYWIVPYIKDFISKSKTFLDENLIDFLKDYSIMDFTD